MRASRDSRPPAHPPASAQPCCWPATAPSSPSTGGQLRGVEASSKKAVGIAHSTAHRVGFRSEGWRRVRLEGWSSMHSPGYGRKQRSRREAWVTQAGSPPHCELSGRPSGIASFDNAPPSAWPPTVQDARASKRQELDAGPHVEPADVRCPATLHYGSQQGQRTPWTCPRFAAIAEP